jgi:phosphate:Na+ symporter
LTESISWFELASGFLGGIALFLMGIDGLTTALRRLAGSRMQSFIAKVTERPWKAVLAGAGATALLQSSSLTSVMAISLVSAGLMTFAQSIGLIMGANIGSTFTVQLIAFRIEDYALVLVALGFGLSFLSTVERTRQTGAMLLGLGFLFLGLGLMSEAMKPLRGYAPFVEMMAELNSPLLGLVAGLLFTAVVQSSAATVAVAILLAAQGGMSLETALGVVMGANIGTCVTAVIAAIGQRREAQRVAFVHVLFNVIGVALFIGFIPWLAAWSADFTPGDIGRQIANVHTFFNIANTLLLVGFIPLIARITIRLMPDRAEAVDMPVRPRYLDSSLLESPSIALENARLELVRVGEWAAEAFHTSVPHVLNGSNERLLEVEAQVDRVDSLYRQVIRYLGLIGKKELDARETRELLSLMSVASALEATGDLIRTGLLPLGRSRNEQNLAIGTQTQSVLMDLHRAVGGTLSQAVRAIAERDAAASLDILNRKPDINQRVEAALQHISHRLAADEPNRVAMYTLETQLVELLKRGYSNAKRLAREVVVTKLPAQNAPESA